MRNYIRERLLSIIDNAVSVTRHRLDTIPLVPYNVCDNTAKVELGEGSAMYDSNIFGQVKLGRNSRMISCSVAPNAVVTIGDDTTVFGATFEEYTCTSIGNKCLLASCTFSNSARYAASSVCIADDSVALSLDVTGYLAVGKNAKFIEARIDTAGDTESKQNKISIGSDAVLFATDVRITTRKYGRYSLADSKALKKLSIGDRFTLGPCSEVLCDLSTKSSIDEWLMGHTPEHPSSHRCIEYHSTLLSCAKTAYIGNDVCMCNSGAITLNTGNMCVVKNNVLMYRAAGNKMNNSALHLSAIDAVIVREGATVVSVDNNYAVCYYDVPRKLVVGERAVAIIDKTMAAKYTEESTISVPDGTTGYI